MRKPRKKRTQRKGAQPSTLRNIALFFLSLGLLSGASLLFSYLGNRADISLDPIQKAFNGMVAEEEVGDKPMEEVKETSSAVSGYDYKFYELLGERAGQEPSEEHFSIQIAAFRDRQQAKEFVQELKEKTRVPLRIDRNGKLSCVRWGSFTTRETAAKQCAKLSDKLKRDCIVVKM